MDIKEILFFINDALANGATSQEVDAFIAGLPAEQQEEVRLAQVNEIPGGAVGDFGRMALQGATFGFADEIIGMFAGDEARERSRQNLSVRRSNNPGTSLMSEIAGGAAVPIGVGGAAVRGGQSTRGLAATGAGLGALEGALFGAGESVEGERAQGAAIGAGVGAVTGGVAAPAGGAAARAVGGRAKSLMNRLRNVDPDRPGPGPRIADSLQELSGIQAGANDAIAVADRSLEQISQTVFSKLDDEFPEVDNGAITTYIRGLTDNKDTRSVVGAVSRELRDKISEGSRLPSFSEVQDIRRRLIRKGLSDEADELTDIMEEVFGEEFVSANAEWRRLSRIKEAVLDGEKGWNLGANQLERRLAQFSNEAERAAYQQGRISEMVQRLQARETGVVAPLTNMLDAGPSTRRQLRQNFPDDESFEGFMQELRQVAAERAAGDTSKVETDQHMRRLRRWIIGGALTAGGGGGLLSFLTGK